MDIESFLLEWEKKEKEEYNFDIQKRKQIYYYLHRNLKLNHRKILLKLLEREMWERKREYYDEIIEEEDYEFELFYWCIFLLSRLGIAEDSLLIWRAKNMDFDASIGVEVNFLIGAGLKETIDYLNTVKSRDAKQLLEYLLSGKKDQWNELKPEYQKEWYEFRINYFNSF